MATQEPPSRAAGVARPPELVLFCRLLCLLCVLHGLNSSAIAIRSAFAWDFASLAVGKLDLAAVFAGLSVCLARWPADHSLFECKSLETLLTMVTLFVMLSLCVG